MLPAVTVMLFGWPHEPRVSVLDGAGWFVFAGLPLGAYPLSAKLSGFAMATVDGIVAVDLPPDLPRVMADRARVVPLGQSPRVLAVRTHDFISSVKTYDTVAMRRVSPWTKEYSAIGVVGDP